jgi:hypothetical protein
MTAPEVDSYRYGFDWQDCLFQLFQPSLQRLPDHRQSFASRNLFPSFALHLFRTRVIDVSNADDSANGEKR